MDYKQLQSFKEVVETENFSTAAENLGFSQPTVSIHIKNLEEELGKQLLIRSARKFELTEKGQEVYECTKSILDIWEGMLETCRDNEKNVITLGASTIPSAYILPKLLLEFGRKYDNIYFVVNQGESRTVIEEIRNGEYDVGLVSTKPDDPSLEYEKFYQDKLTIITPVNAHFLQMKTQEDVHVSELLKEPIILRESETGEGRGTDRLLQYLQIREQQLYIVARVNDQESIKNLVAGGLGISVVSEKAVEDYVSEKRLLSFALPKEVAGRSFYMVYSKNAIKKKHVKVFVDYLKKQQKERSESNDKVTG